ncbi:hypothetical protein L1987_61337 [Smallanthus sonchifolius]|uniref:Uncharacterized protein n=1 Tax=Smallanthus sonchifolius TaxID=185202 RepID=A0ACB9DAS5_9ASTR|nr:hypothetical protein L1987_61337 [Smallanthus sonchifolius]
MDGARDTEIAIGGYQPKHISAPWPARDKNWNLYSSPTFVHDLPGHLLRYPVAISDGGDITALPEFEFFPDTKARVLGTRSVRLPPILTT